MFGFLFTDLPPLQQGQTALLELLAATTGAWVMPADLGTAVMALVAAWRDTEIGETGVEPLMTTNVHELGAFRTAR